MDEQPQYTDQTLDAADERFMREALVLALQAEQRGEVPVGAVLVSEGNVIGRGHNAPIGRNDPTAHAEVMALREAAQRVGNYRLDGTTLYSTLEPCAMCAGALVHARVKRLVFGTRDLRFGGVRGVFRIADSDLLNHRIEIVEGVLGPDCLALIRNFFAARR
jgi:tRNA(adenine34) deaminase